MLSNKIIGVMTLFKKIIGISVCILAIALFAFTRKQEKGLIILQQSFISVWENMEMQ